MSEVFATRMLEEGQWDSKKIKGFKYFGWIPVFAPLNEVVFMQWMAVSLVVVRGDDCANQALEPAQPWTRGERCTE